MSWETLQKTFPWPSKVPPLVMNKQNHGISRESWQNVLAGIVTPVVLEVGVYLGGTARWLLETFPTLWHIGIDVWDAGFCLDRDRRFPPEWRGRDPMVQYYANMKEYRDRCVAVQATSIPGMAAVADHVQPDVIFIDASHDYYSVLTDAYAALRMFPAAVVCGDDYKRKAPTSGRYEVQEAVDRVANTHGLVVKTGPGESRFWQFGMA